MGSGIINLHFSLRLKLWADINEGSYQGRYEKGHVLIFLSYTSTSCFYENTLQLFGCSRFFTTKYAHYIFVRFKLKKNKLHGKYVS